MKVELINMILRELFVKIENVLCGAQVVLGSTQVYSGNTRDTQVIIEKGKITKNSVYNCSDEATDSGPLLITFEVNSPRGAYNRTDSA